MGGKGGRDSTPDKKWRHHFVWQHYLKAWVGADGKLAYRTNGKYDRETTKAIAYGRDFYRLRDIPDDQMRLVEGLIEMMIEPYRTLAHGWIPTFHLIFQAEREYLASGNKNVAFERELDVMKSNLEEDLHGFYEQKAVKPLAALRKQDPSPLQGDDFADFSLFLALQYFRTPKIMSAVTESIREFGIDFAPAWGLLRTIYATNVSGALYLQRRTSRIEFLKADGSCEFITGDQPMINLAAPDGLDLYYPLARKLALRLTPGSANPGVVETLLTNDQVADYNRRIAAASESQLYAGSEAILRTIDT